MSLEEVTRHATSSRRTIVKTGAKMAYAVPVVAATISLNVGESSAQRVSGINPDPACIGATCANLRQCADNPDCQCFTLAGGGGFCIPGSTTCDSFGVCGADLSCPAGQVCVVGTCCGTPNQCAPATLSDACDVADDTADNIIQATQSGPTFGGR